MTQPSAATPPPPPDGHWKAERVEPVPGTGFGLVHLEIAPVFSGLAIGALLAGIASILVSFLVICFGVAGAQAGWGAMVSGAFALLAVLAGVGAVVVGLTAKRQIRHSQEPGRVHFKGRGVAVAGLSCGAAGAGIALLAVLLAVVLQA